MITPSFALTATERVLPRMALDFTTASLDNRVTFTRSGNTATVINSSGYVAGINADLPRFDHDPTTLVCKGLLIEESRTNLATYSEQFDDASWEKYGGSSVSANTVTSPGNTLTGDTATFGSGQALRKSSIVITSGSAYIATFWVKKSASGGATNVRVTSNNILDWNTGTSTSFVLTTSWQRITAVVTLTTPNVLMNLLIGAVDVSGNADATCVGNVDIWGAQLEAGAFPTSYIPTVATTVTRNPDVAVMTSTNFSDWYTATTGAAVVWAIPQTATGTRPLIQFDDTTANEIIVLGGNVANPEMSIVDGGAPQAQIDAGTIVANTAYKLSGAWNTDSCAAAQNGAAAVTDNTATIPTPTQLRIGSDGTNYASAWVQKILYYPQRIIDAEVQAISK